MPKQRRPAKYRRTWRWVTRSQLNSAHGVQVHAGAKQPWMDGIFWVSGKGGVAICAAEWKALFGVNVPTDRPIKVEFSAKVVE